jgi:hypothetical protein
MDAEFSTMLPEEDIGFAFASELEEAEGSMSLATDSGGFSVRNSNDLAGGLARIADETRSYYLIGYKPTNTARDGRFRSIEVKIPGRRGLTVRARKGYYAPSAEEEVAAATSSTDPAFQAALDSPYAIDDIALRMTHFVREETFVDKARVFVAADVDIADLQFEEEAGLSTASLQFLMVTVDRGSGGFFRYDQKIDLRLPPDTRARLERTWLPIVREFELPPGRHRAKIVVRDRNTGRIGTVDHDFEVPELHAFRLSTPVLSDMREAAPGEEGGDRLALMARRDFPGGEPVFCQIDVFGATRLEESGRSRVSMGYEVRRENGTLVTGEAPSLIDPTETGRISRMIGFTLPATDPGEYVIVLRVRDELSGRVIERREPFRVLEPLPTAAAPAVPTAAAGASPSGGS